MFHSISWCVAALIRTRPLLVQLIWTFLLLASRRWVSSLQLIRPRRICQTRRGRRGSSGDLTRTCSCPRSKRRLASPTRSIHSSRGAARAVASSVGHPASAVVASSTMWTALNLLILVSLCRDLCPQAQHPTWLAFARQPDRRRLRVGARARRPTQGAISRTRQFGRKGGRIVRLTS